MTKDIAALVSHVDRKLDGKTSIKLKRRTIGTLAGYKSTPGAALKAISRALEEAGIHHDPAFLSACRPDEWVSFSRAAFHDRGLPFKSERALAEFIKEHYRQLEPFQFCTSVQLERRVGSPVRKIDVYLREPAGHVVCELEYGSGRFEVASQIAAYVNLLEAELEKKGDPKPVRAVVITNMPNPEQEQRAAEWAARSRHRLDWYYYRLELNLDRAHDCPPSETG